MQTTPDSDSKPYTPAVLNVKTIPGSDSEPPPPTLFDVKAADFSPAAARECLAERGFIVLRNCFSETDVDEVVRRTTKLFERPAIAGATGYWKFDHPKKVLDPFVVGGPAVRMMLNETIIEITEAFMDSECILAEVILKLDKGVGYPYFPLHTDFAVGWKKDASMDKGLTAEQLETPVGVCAAIYLRDTSEGAFAYCDGTHKFVAFDGPNITDYDTEIRRQLLARKVRCEGRKGDVVLFDDRGFHGPDQPSRTDRWVILLDYYRVNTFGRTQVTPFPVWTCDLGGLSEKQMRVLGVGADFMVSPQDVSKTRFKSNALYPVLAKIIDNAYLVDHMKQKIKRMLFIRPFPTRHGNRQRYRRANRSQPSLRGASTLNRT